MKLEELFERHYVPRRLRGKSPETSRLYRISIRNFSKTLGRAPLVTDLTNDNVSWHMGRMMVDGRSKATANKDRSQLLALWRFAVRHGMHNLWPEVPAEVEPVREPRAWMLSDILKLFHTVRGLQGNLRGTDIPEWVWWNGLLMLCLDTGERIRAVSKCRWDWMSEHWLLIPAEVRKFGRRDKRFALSPETVQSLALLRQFASGQEIFPWPYCDMYLWSKFNTILKKAGLPHGRADKFHKLRKTHASVIHAAGLDATEALGHSHRRTTERYLDSRYTKETQPSQILQQWLRGSTQPPESRKQA